MSQSSNSTMNSNIFADLSAVMADNKSTSAEAEKGKKRVAPLAPESQIKKRATDHHSCEEQASSDTSKRVDQLKFVSAAEIAIQARTNVQMIPELSDEELLEMAIKFEKEHPQ